MKDHELVKKYQHFFDYLNRNLGKYQYAITGSFAVWYWSMRCFGISVITPNDIDVTINIGRGHDKNYDLPFDLASDWNTGKGLNKQNKITVYETTHNGLGYDFKMLPDKYFNEKHVEFDDDLNIYVFRPTVVLDEYREYEWEMDDDENYHKKVELLEQIIKKCQHYGGGCGKKHGGGSCGMKQKGGAVCKKCGKPKRPQRGG